MIDEKRKNAYSTFYFLPPIIGIRRLVRTTGTGKYVFIAFTVERNQRRISRDANNSIPGCKVRTTLQYATESIPCGIKKAVVIESLFRYYFFKMMMVSLAIILCFFTLQHVRGEDADTVALISKLQRSRDIADTAIRRIYIDWDIEHYPKFLKSCYMNKGAWELLKLKFTKKIISTDSSSTFIISFLGSSVTAGHDSLFNESFPTLVGNHMSPVFVSLGIRFESRNVALGNNPCMPYNLCVKTFAGLDADIVHWEQSYNCGDSPIAEQFVRQAMTIPNQPIVVFSESQTFNWEPKTCDPQPPPHIVSTEDKQMLHSVPLKIVSELNKDEFHKRWGVLQKITKAYHSAGIQTFTHSSFEPYACLGPYIKDFQKGFVSWHPSTTAHKLRAAHHSFFWLTGLR